MNTPGKTLTTLVLLISFSCASEEAKDDKEQSPIPEAVAVIEQSLSVTDRRAILANKIRSWDRLRAERISPLEGETERLKLIEWITHKWRLSDDSDFRRYFSTLGVKESRDIATLLINAWVAKHESGEIAEDELFKSQIESQEFARAFMEQLQEGRQEINNAQQPGTEQPATSPESKTEGSDKPQPEAEGRTR